MEHWKTLDSWDAYTGLSTKWHFDDTTGDLYQEREQDVQPILDRNAQIRNHSTPGKEFRLAASIPLWVIEKWYQEGINVFQKEHEAALKKKLNDPDWAWLRTWIGHL